MTARPRPPSHRLRRGLNEMGNERRQLLQTPLLAPQAEHLHAEDPRGVQARHPLTDLQRLLARTARTPRTGPRTTPASRATRRRCTDRTAGAARRPAACTSRTPPPSLSGRPSSIRSNRRQLCASSTRSRSPTCSASRVASSVVANLAANCSGSQRAETTARSPAASVAGSPIRRAMATARSCTRIASSSAPLKISARVSELSTCARRMLSSSARPASASRNRRAAASPGMPGRQVASSKPSAARAKSSATPSALALAAACWRISAACRLSPALVYRLAQRDRAAGSAASRPARRWLRAPAARAGSSAPPPRTRTAHRRAPRRGERIRPLCPHRRPAARRSSGERGRRGATSSSRP